MKPVLSSVKHYVRKQTDLNFTTKHNRPPDLYP